MEIAFFVKHDRVVPVATSPLVVLFPTILETNLGFLVQGPYRTTPSRDPWNKHCVEATREALTDALLWLRDQDFLDVGLLRCLPLDRTKFEGSMFAPLYEATKCARISVPLLPRFDGGHVIARNVVLARTRELRELLTTEQLTSLYDRDQAMMWLTGGISQDRAPTFVLCMNAGQVGEANEYLSEPDTLNLATARLKDLFAGVADGWLVDDRRQSLRSEQVRELLEANYLKHAALFDTCDRFRTVLFRRTKELTSACGRAIHR